MVGLTLTFTVKALVIKICSVWEDVWPSQESIISSVWTSSRLPWQVPHHLFGEKRLGIAQTFMS